jgi:hypothetical protein
VNTDDSPGVLPEGEGFHVVQGGRATSASPTKRLYEDADRALHDDVVPESPAPQASSPYQGYSGPHVGGVQEATGGKDSILAYSGIATLGEEVVHEQCRSEDAWTLEA